MTSNFLRDLRKLDVVTGPAYRTRYVDIK